MEERAGKVVAISTSREKGTPKTNVPKAVLLKEWGVSGDAHAGPWNRQISLLAIESIEKMREKGLEVGPGDFAENITTQAIDLLSLPVGTKLKVGEEVVLEVTQLGKRCHTGCAIFRAVGECIMPKEGIFARVLKGGEVKVGDTITIL